mgnify:CR=1 FL=1
MINRVILVGRLGRDPEMRQTGTGTPVVNFSVATDRVWKNKNGEQEKQTEWHKIIAWGRLAEICNEYLTKGKQVYIEGRLQTNEWEDKDGNKRYTTEVVANEMKMLGTRSEEGYTSPSEQASSHTSPSEQGSKGGEMDSGLTEDDIPF